MSEKDLLFGERVIETHGLTLLELRVMMDPLLIQLKTVTSICFTSKFIQNILEQKQMSMTDHVQKQEDFNFLSLLYKRNTFTTENLKE